jgi:multicomponent Na+:H+ antiporter subunit C
VSYLPYALAVWLFAIGLYGVVTSRHLVHLVVCLTVCQSSTYVLLLAIGYRKQATAPIYKGIPLGAKVTDPVVQALTLTDVVVSVTVLALLLGVAVMVHAREETLDPEQIPEVSG